MATLSSAVAYIPSVLGYVTMGIDHMNGNKAQVSQLETMKESLESCMRNAEYLSKTIPPEHKEVPQTFLVKFQRLLAQVVDEYAEGKTPSIAGTSALQSKVEKTIANWKSDMNDLSIMVSMANLKIDPKGNADKPDSNAASPETTPFDYGQFAAVPEYMQYASGAALPPSMSTYSEKDAAVPQYFQYASSAAYPPPVFVPPSVGNENTNREYNQSAALATSASVKHETKYDKENQSSPVKLYNRGDVGKWHRVYVPEEFAAEKIWIGGKYPLSDELLVFVTNVTADGATVAIQCHGVSDLIPANRLGRLSEFSDRVGYKSEFGDIHLYTECLRPRKKRYYIHDLVKLPRYMLCTKCAYKASPPTDSTTARVVFDYDPENENELLLTIGDWVHIEMILDEKWMFGSIGKREGLFPRNYVKVEF